MCQEGSKGGSEKICQELLGLLLCVFPHFWGIPENTVFKYLDYLVWRSNKLSFVFLARTGHSKYHACRDRQMIKMHRRQLKQVKDNLINREKGSPVYGSTHPNAIRGPAFCVRIMGFISSL